MNDVLTNFHFLRPYWLLALIPAGIIWFVLREGWGPTRRLGDIIAPHLLRHLLRGQDQRKGLRPQHILLLLWILLIVAVAGPSWRMAPSPFAEDRAGLMLLLKLDPGMEAEDIRPSRLERARHKIRDLLALRTGGLAGLVAYSGSAHLVMPLTRDMRIIEQMAQALDPSVMPTEGDALAEALALAAEQFDRRNTAGSMLVITDGVDPAQIQASIDSGKKDGLAVQILAAVGSRAQAVQSGIEAGAQALGAPFYLMTVDDTDVRRISSRVEKLIAGAAAENEKRRWQDSGYALVPFILFGMLLWARRGWSVRWES
jgi:Ca-activated chloride channel family protein